MLFSTSEVVLWYVVGVLTPLVIGLLIMKTNDDTDDVDE